MNTFLSLIGFLSGIVDSIIGGGALMSIPGISVVLGAGLHSVGTSKIADTLGAAWIVPDEAFRWILLLTCPLILFLVWKKDLWLERSHRQSPNRFRFKQILIEWGRLQNHAIRTLTRFNRSFHGSRILY